ncbi:MAG: hypothetical protein WD011_02180, partial [Nitriliruptoraceae bacterium]
WPGLPGVVRERRDMQPRLGRTGGTGDGLPCRDDSLRGVGIDRVAGGDGMRCDRAVVNATPACRA